MSIRPVLVMGSVSLAFAGPIAAQVRQVQPLTPNEIFQKNQGAIVTIATDSSFGSGVLIESSGVVVTNFHIIEGEPKAIVRLANGDAYDDVSVIDIDQRRDLALLRIKGFKLSTAELGDSDAVRVGDTVYAIGAPRRLDLTLSEGIVSSRRDTGEGYFVIQTTAALSTGSSGGGLFDSEGRLIGVTTFIVKDGENLGFALPINYLRGIMSTTPRQSLQELAAKTATKTLETPSAPEAASSPTPVKAESVPAAPVPILAKTYRSAQGSTALVEQDGAAVSIRFSNQRGLIYGQIRLVWNQTVKGFIGDGTLQSACDGSSNRVWDAPISAEIYLAGEKAIRNRWTHPHRVNCGEQRVTESSWQEVVWQASDR